MRISDWSSDVCSSDLPGEPGHAGIRRDVQGADQDAPSAAHRDAGGQLYRHGEYRRRSEEHTSELQSLMRISYAVFCLKKKKQQQTNVYSSTPHKSTRDTNISTSDYTLVLRHNQWLSTINAI